MDFNYDLHARDKKRMILNHPLLKAAKVTKDDIGKVFVLDPERESGKIMTRSEFEQLPTSQIGGWIEISEFEVNV
jgi:hypothetical protein